MAIKWIQLNNTNPVKRGRLHHAPKVENNYTFVWRYRTYLLHIHILCKYELEINLIIVSPTWPGAYLSLLRPTLISFLQHHVNWNEISSPRLFTTNILFRYIKPFWKLNWDQKLNWSLGCKRDILWPCQEPIHKSL